MSKLPAKTKTRRGGLRGAVTYLALSIWAVVVLFPFYWMVLTSVKSYAAYNAEHVPTFFTLSPTLENYVQAFTAVPLGGYLLNTLIFAVIDSPLAKSCLMAALFCTIVLPVIAYVYLKLIENLKSRKNSEEE